MIINTEALTLNSIKSGDSSKIVRFFTREEGIISVIAKGCRSKSNKFGSSLEPLSHSVISYYKKPNRDLQILSKAELQRVFNKISLSDERIFIGLAILESVSQSQEINVPNNELFLTITDYLNILDKADGNPYCLFIHSQNSITKELGLDLNFNISSEKIDVDNYKVQFSEVNYLSLENGQLELDVRKKNSFRLDKKEMEILFEITNVNMQDSLKVKCDKISLKKIQGFFSQYFSYHLNKKFHYKALELLFD